MVTLSELATKETRNNKQQTIALANPKYDLQGLKDSVRIIISVVDHFYNKPVCQKPVLEMMKTQEARELE